MTSGSQIKFGAILSYLSIGINIVAGLLYTPWMIHSIGKDNYGLYILAMSVISLFLFDFGFSSAVTRFISKYLAEKRQDKANNFLGLVYRLYVGLDIILFLMLFSFYFFIPQIYQQLSAVEIEKFKVVYAMAALYSIFSFPFIPINGVLTAHEKFVQLKVCEIISRLLTILLMSICLILGYGLYAMVLVNALVGIFMIFLKIFCIRKYTLQRVTLGYWNKIELKEIASYSGWITVVALAQRCIFNIAPSILGAISGSSEVAVLGIAITIEGFSFTFSNALSGMFLPRVSRIYANSGDILPLMVKVGRIQILIISLVIFGFVFVGQEFINVWVGNRFNDSYLCAILIILPSLLQLPQEVGMQAIIAQNKVKYQAFVFCVMAVLNIVGSVFLSQGYGAVGLCMSVCIAYLIRTIGLDYILFKKLNINLCVFFKETYLKMLPSIILTLFVTWIFLNSCFITGWVGVIIDLSVFIIVYAIMMFSFAMNSYEKSLIVSPIKLFLKRCKEQYFN